MKLCYVTCVLWGLIYTASSKEVAKIPTVDALIGGLQREQWDDKERPCLDKTLDMLHNVKNLTFWATWIWDANQYPVGGLSGSTHHMGNWDQCMNPPWLSTHPDLRTQYCTAEVKMFGDVPEKGQSDWDPYEPTDKYINTATKWGVHFNKLYWGVCLPSTCQPHSVAKILKHMYSGSQYGPVNAEPNITVEYCQVAGENQQYTFGYYAFIGTVFSLLVTAVVSTVYQSRVKESEQHPGSMESIITKAFCMKRNYNALVKPNAGEIHVMNGIRFITACLIVLLHQVLFLFLSPIVNPLNIQKDLESLVGMVFLHLEIIVDTFFAMSGLLHVRGLMANTRRQKNLISVLWKRYLRLLGPLTITIFYLMAVAKFAGSGPFWPKLMSNEPAVCANTWRLSLFMMNTNVEEICHSVTWYISCDYQLAILGTALFYFYQKDQQLGYTAFGVASVLSVIVPGFLTYWHRLPAMPFPDLRSVMNIRHHTSLELNYTKSYVRSGAYLVGIAMGYFMSVYKPVDYRKKVSTKWSLIGTIASVVLMQSMMGLGRFFMDREYNAFEAVLATTLNRVLWSFGVCCIIAFCEYGSVPIISDFLSLPAFMPLSRLAYGIYVIHPFVIQRSMFTARSPLKYEKFAFLTDMLGTVVTSGFLSFAMWLLVEAPFINLSNNLLNTKSGSSGVEQSKEPASQETIKKNGAPLHIGSYLQNSYNRTKVL